ncbi:MAG: (2Fe-2S)-binding protein [Pseudomonadota bacterium]|nr:(2Fe-2S)-binding protein [Pseudomonadota bacterium]
MHRREFIKLCAGATALAAQQSLAADQLAQPRFHQRALLIDHDGQPLQAGRLAVHRNYIFHYPFAATPCFLLNLGKPAGAAVNLKTSDGKSYEWPGGVGSGRAIVGYSAICAHKLAYPTRQISFISFRGAVNAESQARANTIHCCAEHSEYDPAAGARVLGGPAPQPLAAILLEHDRASDGLTAVGTLGGELFNAFFDKYNFKLALEHGPGAQQSVAGRTVVSQMENYCQQEIRC